MATRQPLDYYLNLQYPFDAIADPDGGYVIEFPDLPGCLTQVETVDEIAEMAEDVRRLWIETEYEAGAEIPLPSYPEEYSGKFNVRLPKSLHRRLAEGAERDGVSLNQFVSTLLAEREALWRTARPEIGFRDWWLILRLLADSTRTQFGHEADALSHVATEFSTPKWQKMLESIYDREVRNEIAHGGRSVYERRGVGQYRRG